MEEISGKLYIGSSLNLNNNSIAAKAGDLELLGSTRSSDEITQYWSNSDAKDRSADEQFDLGKPLCSYMSLAQPISCFSFCQIKLLFSLPLAISRYIIFSFS